MSVWLRTVSGAGLLRRYVPGVVPTGVERVTIAENRVEEACKHAVHYSPTHSELIYLNCARTESKNNDLQLQ